MMEDSPKPPEPPKPSPDSTASEDTSAWSEPATEPTEATAIHALPSLKPIPSRQDAPFYSRMPVTLCFIIILLGVYALSSFPSDFNAPTDMAVMLGGFYPPLVQAGEWWRYITATLMHGNPGHLFNNVMGILIFGNLLEPVIGSLRMIGLYIISAFLGLLCSYYMLPKSLTLGASTIDYGLIGAYLALILLMRYRYDKQTFFQEFRGALFFVLLFIAWNTMEGSSVNLWGHLGGLTGGVLFAVFLWKNRPKHALPER